MKNLIRLPASGGATILAAIMALFIDAMIVRSISLLAPFIRSSLQIDERQVGYLIGSVMAGTFIATLPAGILTGRLEIRRTYTTLTAGISVLLILAVIQTTFAGLLACFFIIGILRSGFIPLVNRLLVENIKSEKRGSMIGFIFAVVPLSGFTAAVLLPALSNLLSWRSGLVSISLLAGTACLITLIKLPQSSGDRAGTSIRADFHYLRSKSFLVLALTYALFSISTTVESFLTLYLVDVIRVSPMTAGTYYGLIQLTGAGGRVMWGLLADRVFRNNRWWLLAITNSLAVGAFILLITLTSSSSPWMIVLTMGIIGISLASSWSILTTLTGDVVNTRSVASATATIYFMTNLADTGGPVLLGNVLKLTGSYAKSFSMYMVVAILSALSFTVMAMRKQISRKAFSNQVDTVSS